MAGLYESWKDRETGQAHNTFTICTTAANERMEWIHNSKKRMPSILSLHHANLWLDKNISFEQKKSLLAPYESSNMLDHPVSRLITSKKENPNVEAVTRPFSYPELES